MPPLDFPFQVDGRGRSAVTDRGDHVRDLIEQVLFTRPGERVNRPDFGCGIDQLVFAPASDALVTATQFLVQGALQRWLADVVQVERVAVAAQESTLTIEVVYVRLDTGRRETGRFSAPVGG
ncbi:MAG TPA: GPW/gp25 family protein [Thermoanaerobaculia bacterium]|nr:GPW/gp25 family protein [Thermoanaerobaculia bacterium]